MPSIQPQGLERSLMPPSMAAKTERFVFPLGQLTANATKTALVHIFDRPAIIRECYFAADAIPNDADGTMLANVHVFDVSEAAFDSIVASFDLETLTTAFAAKKASLVAETAENEWTVEALDCLRVQMVNNSAAIDTNANVVLVVLVQYLQGL